MKRKKLPKCRPVDLTKVAPIQEAADYIGVSRQHLGTLIDEGSAPGQFIGHRWYLPRIWLRAWRKQRRAGILHPDGG